MKQKFQHIFACCFRNNNRIAATEELPLQSSASNSMVQEREINVGGNTVVGQSENSVYEKLI